MAVVLDIHGACKIPVGGRENTNLACTSTRRTERILIVASPDGVTGLNLELGDPDVAITTTRSKAPAVILWKVLGKSWAMSYPVDCGGCPLESEAWEECIERVK